MDKQIQILDCTLRDGGLGLEDATKNKLSSVRFTDADMKKTASFLTNAGIDIIELGSIEITEDDRHGFAIYPDIETISQRMPANKKEGQIFAALYRGPDTPLDEIPDWNENLCEAVRVIIRYSELEKSLDFCAALSKKGYEVFVQPMLTMRYTDEEIQMLIKSSNEMNAYALYFVDSYGYMQKEDIQRLFGVYDRGLKPAIRIGFHAHNNMNLAFANVLSFIDNTSSRQVIIDSCILGMGQGAGNLQTELLVGFLDEEKYNFNAVLNACEIIENYNGSGLWGYSVTRLLPALYKTAYKYSIALRNHYNLTYEEINTVLSQMPEDLKQRYTPGNVVKLLKCTGLKNKFGIEDIV